MTPPSKFPTAQNERSDDDWTLSLSGKAGSDAQKEALQDLAKYLHVVAYNYLHRCQSNSVMLRSLASSEIATIAEDHVGSFMEKLLKDDFELLNKYNQRGRFTAWSAAVLVNMMASAMRKLSWRNRVPLSTSVSAQKVDEWTKQPDEVAMQNSVLLILQSGINEMPLRHQVALVRCLLEGEAAKDVAVDLQTTPNAVNILVHRAKQNMRKYLIANNVDQSVMYLFS